MPEFMHESIGAALAGLLCVGLFALGVLGLLVALVVWLARPRRPPPPGLYEGEYERD